MAVEPKHGKAAKVLVDERDFTGFLRNVTLSASMEPADRTVFGNNDKQYIPGLRDATVSAEGLFSASTTDADDIANFFDGAFGGSTKVTMTIGPYGDSTGNRAFLLSGDPVQWDVSAPHTDLVSVSLDVQASSGYMGGRWLRGLAASTSTGSGGTVNAGGTTAAGGTTGGALAHLHITAERNVTTATVKVQHSTSGSTWADYITFTAATGAKFQRSTASGTVKEKVRATLSTLTEGATGGSLTWAVALARRGSPKK